MFSDRDQTGDRRSVGDHLDRLAGGDPPHDLARAIVGLSNTDRDGRALL